MSTGVFLEIVLTFFLYPVPIFIYRYGIAKKRIEHDKAFKICFWYALIPIIVIAILSRGKMFFSCLIIYLWSMLNFFILGGRWKSKLLEADVIRGYIRIITSSVEMLSLYFLYPVFGEFSFLFVLLLASFLYYISKKIFNRIEVKLLMKKIAREKEEKTK